MVSYTDRNDADRREEGTWAGGFFFYASFLFFHSPSPSTYTSDRTILDWLVTPVFLFSSLCPCVDGTTQARDVLGSSAAFETGTFCIDYHKHRPHRQQQVPRPVIGVEVIFFCLQTSNFTTEDQVLRFPFQCCSLPDVFLYLLSLLAQLRSVRGLIIRQTRTIQAHCNTSHAFFVTYNPQ